MKKNFILTVLFSVLIGLSAIGQIPTNGLVAYYPFNGNANDESGNGNNGTVNGATLTTDRFGKMNSCYNFNGLDNSIGIGNFDFANKSFSISCWVKRELMGNRIILSQGSGFIYYQSLIIGYRSNDIFTFAFWGSDLDVPQTLTDKDWHNYTMTFNSINKYRCIYMDNLLIAHDTANTNYFGINNLIIGVGFVVDYFSGNIDDIRIYDRALNSFEISALYNENICKQSITVTDTLVINAVITGYNPITFQNSIKIFPNPTLDAITIDCGSNYSTLNGYTIKITNSLSQTVYESLVNKQTATINLNTWTGKGIYFVHLIDGTNNTIDIKKIVLQ